MSETTTALITGANRGIGLELTRQLRDRGFRVIACCRRSSEELDALGVQVETGVDVGDPASIREFDQRLDPRQPVHWLLNVAGVMSVQRFGDINENAVGEIQQQFRINSLGPLLMTQALVHRIPEGGRVGVVTSRMGSIADNTSGGSYGYRMSKAAVNMAGVSMAHDLKPRGIAVAILHPGFVRTAMTSHNGHIDPPESAAGLIARMDELHLGNTGTFWHMNGEILPW